MEPIGQLDQHHTDIIDHGQEHLAQALSLLRLHVSAAHLANGVDVCQLCNAIDQIGYLVIKVLAHIFDSPVGVLDHIMQKTCRYSMMIQAKLSQQPRHLNGMHNIGFARCAHLAVVRQDCLPIRFPDQLQFGTTELVCCPVQQLRFCQLLLQ